MPYHEYTSTHKWPVSRKPHIRDPLNVHKECFIPPSKHSALIDHKENISTLSFINSHFTSTKWVCQLSNDTYSHLVFTRICGIVSSYVYILTCLDKHTGTQCVTQQTELCVMNANSCRLLSFKSADVTLFLNNTQTVLRHSHMVLISILKLASGGSMCILFTTEYFMGTKLDLSSIEFNDC